MFPLSKKKTKFPVRAVHKLNIYHKEQLIIETFPLYFESKCIRNFFFCS